MSEVRELPPRGHYVAHEVGQLAGVSGDRIGQWARRGYIRSSQSTGRPRVYSYQDVGEAMVVHELEDAGATLRSIKKAIKRLRQRSVFDWPLSHAALATLHGRVIGFDREEAYDLGGEGSEWQRVIAPRNLEKIAAQLERGGWAVRQLPRLERIEVNPDRLAGRPAIRGRRISAADVATMALEDDADILESYELEDRDVQDALHWWQAVQGFEEAA